MIPFFSLNLTTRKTRRGRDVGVFLNFYRTVEKFTFISFPFWAGKQPQREISRLKYIQYVQWVLFKRYYKTERIIHFHSVHTYTYHKCNFIWAFSVIYSTYDENWYFCELNKNLPTPIRVNYSLPYPRKKSLPRQERTPQGCHNHQLLSTWAEASSVIS